MIYKFLSVYIQMLHLSRLCNFAEEMEHGGLSKNNKDALFDSLELLNRLTDDCIGSDAPGSNTCHHHSDDQTGETTSSRVRHQSDHHGATADATPDERSPNADLMAKSFNHHDLAPLSFYSSPTIDCIQDTGSTNSVNRHSNDRQLCDDRFITRATNGCQTTCVSKR